MDFSNEGTRQITQNPTSFLDQDQIRVLLLDIEGTTTPIDFVYKTLFPYANRKLESFLRTHSHDPEIQLLIQDLHKQSELDESAGNRPPAWRAESEQTRLQSCVAYAHWLMARDSKGTALKALQGKIWQEGYENGALRGEVYPDVPRALDRWRRQGRQICIYSSGSVLAQQLLFRTVPSGDLTTHIAGFFDTQVGSKTDCESYQKIAASVGRAPGEVFFISDAAKEIEAARSAGMRAILCNRDAPSSAQSGESATIRSLDEIRSFDEVYPD
jgi:enolase-phosphatase E1